MTRSRNRLVAHVVLVSFVVDSALAARIAPEPAKPGAMAPVSSDARPTSNAQGVRPVAIGRALEDLPPPVASPSSPAWMAPPAPAVEMGKCGAALVEGGAPVTTLARTHLWPPNHALIDVGLAVDPTPECAGIVELAVAVWGDEADDAPTGDGVTIPDARFVVPDLYLRAERTGDGNGRVYLVITRASAGSAEGVTCRTVVVPHSGSARSMDAVNQQAAAARATCEATGGAPPSFVRLAEAEFSPANQAPIVAAGPDQGVAFAGSATLDGTASDDGLPGGNLELEWTQVFGLGQASFSDAHIADPTVTVSVAGSYTLRLTARDGELQSHDEVVIVFGVTNEAPQVDAGNDQSLVLPSTAAALQGAATDDGHPNPALTISWSVVTVPTGGSVVFSAPSSLATSATLSAAGEYVLRLTADDGQLSSADDLTVTLHPESPPILSVSDHSLPEGNDGRGGGELHATLSKSWPRPVTVDFMTSDGSATAHCDYSFRYGTLTFDPGQTEASVLLPVMGELAPEAAETVVVRLGNVTEAILAADHAVLTILDDDAPNRPPTVHTNRSPADDATGVPLPPTLAWISTDADAGDTVVHDIHLGTTPSLDGQSWVKVCPATPGPGPSSVFGFDDAADRLIVLEQGADGSTGARVWVLDHASGAGGPPRWMSFETQGHPLLHSARAAYDSATDALIVVGRCEGGCGGTVQTWVLHHASGHGTPAWQQIPASGPPVEVTRFAMAHSGAANRIFLFGGVGAGETRLADLWVLEGADGTGSPAWARLEPEGEGPGGRDAASLVVDTRRSRLLLFGGSTGTAAATNEVWALDGLDSARPSWQLLPMMPGPAPASRFGHAAAFDAGSGRMLVFGGSTPGIADNVNFVFSDAWLLDGLTWTRIAVPGPVPAGRFDGTIAFSPSANRLIVGAGANNKLAAMPADLWVLSDAMGSLPAVALGQASASHSPEGLDAGATYLWRVVTRDGHGAWRGSPTWSFTANAPPLVAAGADHIVALPPGTAALAGSVTDDGLPASGQLTMQWTMVSGPAAVLFSGGQTPTATATFSTEGTYVLRLAASDGVLAAHDDVTVVVEPPNAPPSVDAGVNQTVALPQTTASLAGTVGDDGLPVGGALTVEWSQQSGPSQAAFAVTSHATTSVTLGAAGSYILRLTASDGRATAFDDVTVTVTPANGAPKVDTGPDQAITFPVDTAELTGTVVDDGRPFGTLTHAWAQLSGPAAVLFGAPAAPVTTATFTQIGAYRLRLSVSDGALSADDEMKVVVGSASVLPDLVIERVDTGGLVVDPSTLAMTGTVVAEVGNPGPGAAAGAFAVTFFEDTNRSGAFEGADDRVLGTATAGALGPGETVLASAPVWGTAAFSGNLVFAFADSGAAIVEANEGNNYGSSAPVCAFTPPARAANPALEWAWTGSPQAPLSNKVWGSPLVIDLDLDGTPEILFQTNPKNGFTDYGVEGSLRAVNGATHAEVFTTSGADQWLNSMSPIAAGNIDADPYPEIIAVAHGESHLIAFEHDGTLKWRSVPVEQIVWGGVALADLDGDGVAEIVLGRQVLNADGTLRWTGTGGRGGNGSLGPNTPGMGPNATVVDLDLDGHPEVIAGNTAYRGSGPQQGQIVWQTTSAPAGAIEDGYTAAANFDADANPEIVLVTRGMVWMLEHDGAVKWGPVAIPGSTTLGGSPVIGNLDGDPELEFVVGGRQRVTVFESDGTVSWSAPSTQSNQVAAAALFDFDGDGAAEIAYNDEHSLRIFGHGQVLYELPTYTAPGRGSVVIADADGDGKPEIVLSDNGVWSVLPGAAALRVYGDSADTWTLSRPLWNQFEYHVSNVNDDGTIPVVETRSLTSSRQNAIARVGGGAVIPGCAYAKPDLTASFLRVARDADSASLTARIGNGGAAVAGLGVPVTFYDGDPAAGSPLLGTVHTSMVMAPGAFEDVVLILPAAATTRRSIWVAADDFGNLHGMTTESNEGNNVYDSGQALLGQSAGVDLVVTDVYAAGIVADPATGAVSGTVRATIRNQGDAPATAALAIAFFEDADADGVYDPGVDVVLGQAVHAAGLGGRENAVATASVSGVARFAGNVVHAMVDSAGSVAETDETNNVGWSGASCRAVPPVGLFTPAIERRWTTSPTQPASTNVAATPLVADLDGDGVADIIFVTFTGAAATSSGRLRALSGRDGHEMFTITNSAYALSGWANLAIGDIDGDSRPEIVAVHEQGRLIAFEHDGAFKWLSEPLLGIEWGGPAIADLDGVGLPEIVLGRQALRADGSLLWTAALGFRGGNGGGTFATVADLDLDGTPEVILGPAAYSNRGVLLWNTPFLPDGNTAVANFDSDPFPEIVLVAQSQVRLLEHTGAVRWGPVTVPGAGLGSAPVIADFDGDGRPEIGVGNRRTYTVIETSGIIRWSVATSQPASIWNIGVNASAFDFDGDGAAELVFSDESGVKVLRGLDGSLLAGVPVPSCELGRAFPVVADVDGDGNAEIVAVANQTCSTNATVGVAIIGEAHDRWVTARPLWNQYDYRITNVGDDASVPPRAVPSWPGSNTFRANSFGNGSPFRAPDMKVSDIRRTEDGADLVFTVRVGNSGDGVAGAAVPVSLYNGDPGLGFPRVATVTTTRLLGPGEFEDVSFRVASATAAEDRLVVGVDRKDGGASTVSECNEDDNLVGTDFYLNREPVANAGPDSAITSPQAIAGLSGTASDDGLPLGSTLVFGWDYIAGPTEAPPAIADSTALTTTVHLVVPGQYVFRLIASDSVRSLQDLVVVTLHPANQAPQVDAGPDRILAHPTNTTVLTGTVGDDGLPAGGVLTYQWAVVGVAPGTAMFATPTAISTAVQFAATGTYRLRLAASDGGRTTTDEVEVIVDPANVAPTVNAGPDRILPGRAGQMAGISADDGLPRNGTLEITWSVVQGVGAVAWADSHDLDTTVEFSADGLYLLRLTATDGALFAHDDVVVRVNPVNVPPLVDAGPDQALTTGSTVLAANVADDGLPAGGRVTATWSVASGPGHVTFVNPSVPTTAVSFAADGDYVLTLSATDSVLAASDTVAISVTAGNHAPFVRAGPDQSLPPGAFATSVAGEITDDGTPGGAILASWSQVSGPGAASFGSPHAASSTVAFDGPGVYVLRLTASDGMLAGNDDVAVEAGAASPSGPSPTASITSPAPGLSLGQPTMIRGSVASGTLAGWRLEHRLAGDGQWTRFGFGTTAVTDADLSAFDPTLLLNGLYHVRLVVTDKAGRSAQATTQVVVKENFKVGHFTVSFVDLEVPVAGIPIQVGRTYDSRDKRPGDFGPGWRLDVSNVRLEETGTAGVGWVGTTGYGQFPTYCLQTQSPKVVAVTLPNGLVFEFDAMITPTCRTFVPPEEVTVTYRPRAGTQATLVPMNGNVSAVIGGWPEAGGSAQMQLFGVADYTLFDPDAYELTLPDGRAFVVSQLEGLRRITDLSGNVLSVDRHGITHSSGRGVAFVRNASGSITSVVDPEGHPTVYAYQPSGDLDAVTDREGHATRFRYHPVIAHHLESIKDPLGRTPIRNEYDEGGRLARHIDAFGKVIEYTHSIGVRQEIVKDRNDKQRVLEYDERGNVVREIDPTGKVVVRTFDLRNNRLTETVPHVPGTPTPPVTVYVYDGSDNVMKVTDAENHRTDYTYNARKQVRTTKDALDRVTENTYDPVTGNLLTSKDALNQVTTYTCDPQGNVATQTVTVDGVPHVTSYGYDSHGNLARETDALGHETTFTHDLNGNRLTQTTTRGIYSCTAGGCTQTSVQTLTTTYVYDLAGRLKETLSPDGTSTRTVYDVLGRQAETNDALGHRTAFVYDEMGRLTKTTFVDDTFEESTYDNEGRRLTSQDREGRITSYLYDDVGRLTRTTYPDLTFAESTYDDAGRLVASRDARGKTTTYGYDKAGRRTSVKDPLLNETIFGYDANGNQTTVKDALGRITTYEYDVLNRRTKTIFPDLSFTTTAYDALGRRRSETDQAGKTTWFEYDKVGRLVLVRDAAGKETKYTYDELGNRIAQRDANGRVTAFEYDKMGRETARVLPDGARETRAYDVAGNVHLRTDFMGRDTTYAYDATNRPTSRSYSDASQDVSFTYTPAGRRLTATDARGTTTYGYDVRQRLASLTYPDGRKLEYGYDANGNRASLVAHVGTQTITTGFTYDDAGRLDVMTDPLGRAYDHAYDANGNRDSLAYPNGTVTDYTYNTLNRLTLLSTTRPATGQTIQSYGFTLGPAGNRKAINEADGTIRAYTYDDLYRLTGERVTVGVPVEYEKMFTYDDVGNRLTQVTTGSGAPGTPLASASLGYGYDTRDRLLTETLGANPPTTFGYDDNGNLISKSADATYTWDFENRLIRVATGLTGSTTVTEHAYDADGNRLQTKVTPPTGLPTVTNYLVDTSGSLSHVVAETDDAGALKAYYVRADDLLAVMRPLVPAPAAPEDWQTRFVHADGIGSIRRLTDEAGGITDGYTYTAFGELIAHTGTDPQPYAFAGEPYDPNSGFQYHRARWMDPRSGRFLGMDPYAGSRFDPPSLHKYLYVNADPVDKVDPSGMFESLSQTLTTISGQITLIGSRVAAGTITRLGAVRAIRALNWTFGILTAAYAKFGNISVNLEQSLERHSGRVDIVLKTAPQVIRRAVIEGKAWSFDAIAQAPGRAASMLDQLRLQATNYALEFGDDLIYAFPELPKTPAGQAFLTEVQAIFTSAGVQRVTFGTSHLMDEVATLLGL